MKQVGILVGDSKGEISRCYTSGNLAGKMNMGGIAGLCRFGGVIEFSASNLDARVKDGFDKRIDINIGGIAGAAESSRISNCYANGTISILKSEYPKAGGILGNPFENAEVLNSYASFSMITNYEPREDLGGIIGNGRKRNSFSNCYWNFDKFQPRHLKDEYLVGSKTTEEMLEQATYEDWDFDSIWSIEDGKNYPLLQWLPDFIREAPVTVEVEGDGDVIFESHDGTFIGLVNEGSSPYIFDRLASEAVRMKVSVSSGVPLANWIVDGKVYTEDTGYELFLEMGESSSVQVIMPSESQIRTIEELQKIGNDDEYPLEWNYVLVNDIDGSVTANWNNGDGFIPIGSSETPYRGILEGQGFAIKNLKVDANDYVGLFASAVGTVQNLNMKNCDIRGHDYVGTIAGSFDGVISGCTSSGVVFGGGSGIGGLIGASFDGIEVLNCNTSTTVGGGSSIGGLAGGINDGSVINCFTTGDIVNGNSWAGGLIGRFMKRSSSYNKFGTMKDCYSTGNVDGGANYVGGLVGYCDPASGVQVLISNCFATGEVSGDKYVGGLLGRIYYHGTIQHCYRTGSTVGNIFVGGIAGDGSIIEDSFVHGSVLGEDHVGGISGNPAYIVNSYAACDVDGSGEFGGLIGEGTSSPPEGSYWDKESTGQSSSYNSLDSFGKTTAEMLQQSTYEGWDFENVWAINNGFGYPYFRNSVFAEKKRSIQLSVSEDGSILVKSPSGAIIEEVRAENSPRTIELGDLEPVLLEVVSDDGYLFRGWESDDLRYDKTRDSPIYIGPLEELVISGFFIEEVIEINSIEEFQKVSYDPDYPPDWDYILGNDIDATVTKDWNDGEGFRPIGDFEGSFDGRGFTISNLVIERPGVNQVALFSSAGSNSEIFDLILENISVSGHSAATLVGRLEGAITNCHVSGKVSGGIYIGGIARSCLDAIVMNCSARVMLENETKNIGGLSSSAQRSIFQQCAVEVTIDLMTEVEYVGGLFGLLNECTVSDCFVVGSISGNADSVGGVSGRIYNNTIIDRCYAAVFIASEGNNIGGMIGEVSNQSTIEDSYWDVDVSGLATSANSDSSSGKTSLELLEKETFVNWDFENVWMIDEGISYPALRDSMVGSDVVELELSVTGFGAIKVFDADGRELTVVGESDSPASLTVNSLQPLRVEEVSEELGDTHFRHWVMSDGLGEQFRFVRSFPLVTFGDLRITGVFLESVERIDSIEKLQRIGQDIDLPLDWDYKLTADIDASDTIDWNDGSGFLPIGSADEPFVGSLDGNEFVIANLSIHRSSEENVGLFRVVAGTIRNLGLENCNINGNSNVGSIAGRILSDSIVEDTFCIGNVKSNGSNVGGLIGYGEAGASVFRCYTNVGVTCGDSNLGGLIGLSEGTVISECYSTGGLVLQNAAAGGLVGRSIYSIIADSFSTAAIEGVGKVFYGGLVGYDMDSAIIRTYAAGPVMPQAAANVGGLVGFKLGGTIEDSYWDKDATGLASSSGSSGDSGKLTGQMLAMETFAAWNFDSNWTITEGVSYPSLQTHSSALVNFALSIGIEGNEAGVGHVVIRSYDGSVLGEVRDGNSVDLAYTAWMPLLLDYLEEESNEIEFAYWAVDDHLKTGGRDIRPFAFSTGHPAVIRGVFRFPYIAISSIEEFQKIGKDAAYPLDWSYVLTDSLDASATEAWDSEKGFEPVGNEQNPFSGVFDGRGYVIRNLFIDRTDSSFVGLFGVSNGTIKNLGLANYRIAGGNHVTGSMVGKLYSDESGMSNCFAQGEIFGLNNIIGGLIGVAEDTAITQCYASVVIDFSWEEEGECGESGIGGLIGLATRTSVSDSYSVGSMSFDWSGSGDCVALGGFVGRAIDSTLSRSYAKVQLDISGSNMEYSGDFVGQLSPGSLISDSLWGYDNDNLDVSYYFSEWDFESTWARVEGFPPYLKSLMPDEDGDFLPDPWELSKVSNLIELSGRDQDKDGASNLLKYCFGLDPDAIDHFQPLNIDKNDTGGSVSLVGSFRLRSDNARLYYNVAVSEDLINWTVYPLYFEDSSWKTDRGFLEIVNETDNGDGTSDIEVRELIDEHQRFMRISVEVK